MNRCYFVQQSCMELCENELCQFDCYNSVSKCIDECPCQRKCPTGCINCLNPICECSESLPRPNYQKCETLTNENYLTCVGTCEKDNFECVSKCNRDFNQSIQNCPCGEYCPDGCPCSNYECDIRPIKPTKSVLILNSRDGDRPPVITDGNGRSDPDIFFKFNQNHVELSCSLMWQNEWFIFGHGKQILHLDSCQLNHIGQVEFFLTFMKVNPFYSYHSILTSEAVQSEMNKFCCALTQTKTNYVGMQTVPWVLLTN